MPPTKMNSKVNSKNSKLGGKKIPAPSSLNGEEISKALNELIPEPDFHGSKFLDKYFVPFGNKTVKRIFSENQREQKTPQLIVAELSSQGPTSSRRKYILLSPAETPDPDEQPQASTSPHPSPAHSSQSSQSPQYQLIDISGEAPVLEDYSGDLSFEEELHPLENYDGNKDSTLKKRSSSSENPSSEKARKKQRVVEEQKEEEIHCTLNKRPASSENPRSEEARKKQRVKEQKVDEASVNELKKKLMMLRIKNKELDIQRKQVLMEYYNLEMLHLKTRMGLAPATDFSSETGDTNTQE